MERYEDLGLLKKRLVDCDVCNIRGMQFENVNDHLRSSSHKYMKMFYDNGLWPNNDDNMDPNNLQVFKFLDFKGSIMCMLCAEVVPDGNALLKHQHQTDHLKVIIERKLQDKVPVIFACDTCNIALRGHLAYFQHNSSEQHKQRLAASSLQANISPSANISAAANSMRSNVDFQNPASLEKLIKDIVGTSGAKSSSKKASLSTKKENTLSLNYNLPFVQDLLKNLNGTLNTLIENNDKTNLLVAGLLKSELDFSGTDRSANLRQILLRQIAQECKARSQTRRSMEEMVMKHTDGLLDLSFDKTANEKDEKRGTKRSGETKKESTSRSSRKRSRSRSRTPPGYRSFANIEEEAKRNVHDASKISSSSGARDSVKKPPAKSSESKISSGKSAEIGKKLSSNGSLKNAMDFGKISEKTQAPVELLNNPKINRHSSELVGKQPSKQLPSLFDNAAFKADLASRQPSKQAPSLLDNAVFKVPAIPPPYNGPVPSVKEANLTSSKPVAAKEAVKVGVSPTTAVSEDIEIVDETKNSKPEITNNDDAADWAKSGGKNATNLRMGTAQENNRRKKMAHAAQDAQNLRSLTMNEVPDNIVKTDQSQQNADNLPTRTTNRVDPPAAHSSAGLSLIEKLGVFFGTDVRHWFLTFLNEFKRECGQLKEKGLTWNETTVHVRDTYRRRFATALNVKEFSELQKRALLIMFDMKLDSHVRRGQIHLLNFPYPLPGEVVFKLTRASGSAEVWNFEPPLIYYDMYNLVKNACAAIGLDPSAL